MTETEKRHDAEAEEAHFAEIKSLRLRLANKQETIKRLQAALHAALERIDQLSDPEEKQQ